MKQINRIICMLGICFLITGCSLNLGLQDKPEVTETGFVAATSGVYDSADTAVIVTIDTKEKQITLKNMDIMKQYTLQYDGATCFFDQYGSNLAAAQMHVGDVVDLTFFKGKKRLNTMQISPKAWAHEAVSKYAISAEKGEASVGASKYAFSEDAVLSSDGEPISLEEIHSIDLLTFRGVGANVYSVTVERGHGYVRLKNDEYFYGGWVEVGNSVIQKVSENMLLVVPEGTHQVLISNKGTSGVKEVTVERNTEVDLNVGDLKGKEPKYGTVLFTIEPETAELYIDGEKTDYSEPVKMEYGIHQMIVMDAMYETLTQYIKVGQASAGITVTMTKLADLSGNDWVSGNDLPEESEEETTIATQETSATNFFVTVDSPVGTELYLDGNYVGITPCSFKKEAGSHVLTLRKTGYTAKSYTVQIDSEEKNISYAFLELTKIE